MKIQTHIAFGLFLATILYYFLNIDFTFVLLTGFSAFIPDIDWAMQFKWNWGKYYQKALSNSGQIHRTVLHNIWAMIIFAVGMFLFSKSLIATLGVIIGVLSHLIADSLTVSGVYWLWPYGDERIRGSKRFWKNGPFHMNDPKEQKFESYIQIILLTVSGLIFLVKGIKINLFSYEGLITLAVLIFVGYMIMKRFNQAVVKFIRSSGI